MEYKLTVAIITVNRAIQLKEAIESCLESNLPEKTEFVIVDNGSVDETEQIVKQLKEAMPYELTYHKEPVNVGAGKGRNICFDLAKGEYIFFLDDDGSIKKESQEKFFIKSIAYLDKNPCVALLTANIDDKVFGERRCVRAKSDRVDGLPCVYNFHEGAVFFRRSAFDTPLYMDIMYGQEGLSVSIRATAKGFKNVYDDKIFIDHKPMVNKWNNADKDRTNLQSISNIYAIKKVLYPVIAFPLLHMAYLMRLKKNGVKNKKLIKEFAVKRNAFVKNNKFSKIKLSTLINSYRQYGMTVF